MFLSTSYLLTHHLKEVQKYSFFFIIQSFEPISLSGQGCGWGGGLQS